MVLPSIKVVNKSLLPKLISGLLDCPICPMTTMPLYVRASGDRDAGLASEPCTTPTIVFLHSVGGSGRMWQPQIDHLSAFHCLAPDLPGHGQSVETSWRSLDETARQIAQLIHQQAHNRRAHIVGTSLGAYVALQLLSHYPHLVERVMLSGLSTFPWPPCHPMFWMMRRMGALISACLPPDFIIKLNAQAMQLPNYGGKRYRDQLGGTTLEVLLEASRYTLPANIASIQHPILVTAGEHDLHRVHESLPLLVNALPQGEGFLVPNVSHHWVFEAPDLFTQTVAAWCSAAPLPADLIDINELIFA